MYGSNVVKTAANSNWHDQSLKQTGDQASSDAIFPVQSAKLKTPTLLHYNYTLLLTNILIYILQATII